MADAFVGEIRVFAGNFPPRGWASCDGSVLNVSQYPTLFSILGTRYGGDGASTFALPNLMGRTPMGQGAGPGLTPRPVGSMSGTETQTLSLSEIPSHTHTAVGLDASGGKTDPTYHYWAEKPGGRGAPPPAYALHPTTSMSPQALTSTGTSFPHNNMQPYLAMHYIICINGEIPIRE